MSGLVELGIFLPCSGRWEMLLCVPLLPVELLRMRSTQEGLRTSLLSYKLCSWGTKGQELSWSGPQPYICSTWVLSLQGGESSPHGLSSPRVLLSSPQQHPGEG